MCSKVEGRVFFVLFCFFFFDKIWNPYQYLRIFSLKTNKQTNKHKTNKNNNLIFILSIHYHISNNFTPKMTNFEVFFFFFIFFFEIKPSCKLFFFIFLKKKKKENLSCKCKKVLSTFLQFLRRCHFELKFLLFLRSYFCHKVINILICDRG